MRDVNWQFETDRFVSNVQARSENYRMRAGEALRHGLPDILRQYQEARSNELGYQQQQLDLQGSVADLQMDEIRRQQAITDLSFAREIHGADMIALQKRQFEAQTKLMEAETDERIENMRSARLDQLDKLNPEMMLMIRSLGYNPKLSSRGTLTLDQDVSPEDRKKASDELGLNSLTIRRAEQERLQKQHEERMKLEERKLQIQQVSLAVKQIDNEIKTIEDQISVTENEGRPALRRQIQQLRSKQSALIDTLKAEANPEEKARLEAQELQEAEEMLQRMIEGFNR